MTDYCDPEWHNGEQVPATHHVKATLKPRTDGTVKILSGYNAILFACCDEHLAQAIRYVNTHYAAGGTRRRNRSAYVRIL